MKSITLPQRTLPRFLSTSLELQRAATESALRKRIRAAREALFKHERELLELSAPVKVAVEPKQKTHGQVRGQAHGRSVLTDAQPSSASTSTLAGIQAALRPARGRGGAL